MQSISLPSVFLEEELTEYRIGGKFRGMKFLRISQMIPGSRTYHHEHFMLHQCKLLDMMPPGEDL